MTAAFRPSWSNRFRSGNRRGTPRKPTKKPPEYEQRLILFLDFLGFKASIAETESNPVKLGPLLRAIDAVGEILHSEIEGTTQQVTQFSDSIVVSYRIDEKSAVFDLISDLALAVIDVVSRGYLVRGAVTIGPLLHTRDHLVGPAMVRAYEMESQWADFPRVIIDPAVIDVAQEHRKDGHTAEDEKRYVASYLKRDADGRLYFDYISHDSVVEVAGGGDDGYSDYMSVLSGLLKRGLSSSDPRILESISGCTSATCL